MPVIHKVLIANRGEITVRIARTLKKMGITVAGVHSESDKNASFVKVLDDAVNIGGMTALESYLDIKKIIAAAKSVGADAIHPGFGFLSENAVFAKAVMDAGLIFIGPKPKTIEQMGSKSNSKNLMKKAGVPVIPGYNGSDQDLPTLLKEAKKVGLPVMIKASAGGGGKGLKLAHHESELEELIASAKREAKNAFNDDTLLIEKFIENPRHIEVQIFGDSKGNVIYLNERECTLQRRHQKVIEEAPSAVVDAKLRKKLGEAAVLAAKTVHYENAGTVEFVMGAKGDFYFLEMNTRLQVEHPVTEMTTGLDLVELQIRVAEGKALPLKQTQVKIAGHAVEARLYAEDPANNFMPATGKIALLDLPEIPGLRYDMGVTQGDSITPYFDPMLGKIIAHGKDRDEALDLLARALGKMTVLGSVTNIGFLKNLLEHKEVHKANFHTGFIAAHLNELAPTAPDLDHANLAAFAFLFFGTAPINQNNFLNELAGFRVSQAEFIATTLESGGKLVTLAYRVVNRQSRTLDLLVDNKTTTVTLLSTDKNELAVKLGAVTKKIIYTQDGETIYIKTPAGSADFKIRKLTRETSHSVAAGDLTAPLPGKVLKVFTSMGSDVCAGATLMIVEAMKMEHPIKAGTDGKIKAIHFNEGAVVKLGDVLIEIDAA